MQQAMRVLISVLVELLAALLLRAVNLKKERRGRQILAVYLSPLFAIVGVAAAYVFFDKIDALNRIVTTEGGPFFGAEVVIWNVILAAAFALIKLILCPIMNKVWANPAQMRYTSDTWYEYDEDSGDWFLRLKYSNVRTVFNVLSWVLTVICAILLALGVAFGKESIWWIKAFPTAALIVVTEIYNFLSGYTKPEYLRTVDGEGIGATSVGAYYKLRNVYESMLPSAMLVSHTGNEYAGKAGATELLRRYRESEDAVEQFVGDYFTHLKKKDGLFDVDLVTMTNTLLHGESAVVFNPFYRDLGEYLLLPLVHNLINNRKCLIIIGRSTLCADVIAWANDILKKYSKTRSLWRVKELTKDEPDCEVGVLSFSQIYDASVINANTSYFQEVSFVLLIEPSKMIATSQTGLEIIVENMVRDKQPVFCVCDHDVDGLVDTLSHILKTNITNVVAAPIPHSVYTVMGWDAAGDFMRQRLFGKQTHYLGNGVELAAIALKNQIPHVSWYSAEKAPVQDIRWIAGQYYPQICRCAHMQSQQKSIDERITFSSNLWGSETRNEEFVIAEDEFCNLFASMRAFLTRGEMQSFVNVISESYLLRDYMRYNRQLFMTDPKAIPAIAAHYARTERNTVLQLILMMACAPVAEEYIKHELSILGYETEDPYRTLSDLIYRYTFVADTIISVQNLQELDDELVPAPVCKYSIPQQVFDRDFAQTLKNAYFVVEDEKFGKEYIDARLFEHITQTVMPGQFLTYNGKLYKVHMVSPVIGCVLHRAADSYTNRLYYKQLRTYHFEEGSELVRTRKVMDIEVALERRSFGVSTTGYLELRENHDLRSAKLIDLSEDPGIAVYERAYKNKTVLRIALPDTDVRIRFTICMLLGEMFRSIFPDAWPYLAVLSARPQDVEGMLDKFNYHVDGRIDENMIYIVEDSDMDLGLLEAIDNNLMRFFEIMSDYLEWHFEKMKEPPAADPVLSEIEVPKEEETRRRNFFSRIARRIMRLFGASDESEESNAEAKDEETPAEGADHEAETNETQPDNAEQSPFAEAETPAEAGEDHLVEPNSEEEARLEDEFEINADAADEQPAERADEDSAAAEEEPAAPSEEQIVLHTEGEDLFAIDGVPDDLDILMPITPSRYQKECFLKFGFDEIDARLSIEDVSSYLKVRGWSNNDLTKARKRTGLEESRLDLNAENFCDFCGIPLTGVSYERLADGRTRCNDCAMTAINEVAEFRKLFRNAEMMMENVFGITITVPIAVRTADAQTIAKHTGQVFKPSRNVAERTLGFAQRKGGKYTLFVENGSPRLAAIDTTIHELTHIWQYLNWNDGQILRIYGQNRAENTKTARYIVYEGMAMWAAIQMLYAMGEISYARQQEQLAEARNDVYGIGFRLYRDRYDLARSGDAPALSPFASFPPLDPEEVRTVFEEDE
ncbi:MAG: hypothetical protein ACI4XW_13100 [Candidatus Spyradocola sp.]